VRSMGVTVASHEIPALDGTLMAPPRATSSARFLTSCQNRFGVACVVCSLGLPFPGAAWGWLTRLSGTATPSGRADACALGPAGDVVAAGLLKDASAGDGFAVVKLSERDGSEVWRYVTFGTNRDVNARSADADSVRTDAAGDVVAAGLLTNDDTAEDAAVVKLAGSTGTEIWRHVVDGGAHDYDSLNDVVLDGAGDAYVVGILDRSRFVAMRLSGETGDEVWRVELKPGDGISFGDDLVLDAAGNVLAVGTFAQQLLVVKLAGTSGAELWRALVGEDSNGFALALDTNGDVVAAGSSRDDPHSNDRFTVAKFAGTTGSELWRWRWRLDSRFSTFASAVAVDFANNVVVGGERIVKLSGGSGAVLWNRRLPDGRVNELAIDREGDAIVVGVIGPRFAAAKFDGRTGRLRWHRTLRGNRFNGGQAGTVVLDGAKNVIVGGTSAKTLRRRSDGLGAFTVAKVCSSNGRVRDSGRCR